MGWFLFPHWNINPHSVRILFPMPRRPRDDLRPVVWIEEHPLQEKIFELTRDVIGEHDQVIVRKRPFPYTFESFFTIYDSELWHKIDLCKQEILNDPTLPSFDHNVFMELTREIELSEIRPLTEFDKERRDILRLGQKGDPYIMVVVGCRVKHEGIAELAKKIGVSSSKLEKQLRLYRKVGLVVNQANATSRPGFIELNANVVWRGKYEHWKAYRKVQRDPKLLPLIGNNNAKRSIEIPRRIAAVKRASIVALGIGFRANSHSNVTSDIQILREVFTKRHMDTHRVRNNHPLILQESYDTQVPTIGGVF